MRYTGKNGWKASYRDTWSLDMALSPIILAGLKKFKEVMDDPEKNDWFGVPVGLAGSHSLGSLEDDDDSEHDKAFEEWQGIIDKMIYAFDPENDPDRKEYDYKFIPGEHDGEKEEGSTCRRWHKVPTNQVEWDRYLTDSREYEKRKQEGRELLGRYFSDLWW